MFSTRNASLRRLLLCGAAVVASATPLFSTGCQKIPPLQPDTLNDAPLIVDEAMQIRDWDRSTAYYASGAVEAGATRLTFEPKYDRPRNYVADPLIGLGNFVIIPFTYFWIPPGEAIVHRGTIIPPSHTAMPVTRVIE